MEDLELQRLIRKALVSGCMKLDAKLHPEDYFPGEAEAFEDDDKEVWSEIRAYIRTQRPKES